MKISAATSIVIVGVSCWAIIAPVSANYLRNPQTTPCSLRTCTDNTDCCSDGWSCNLDNNKCEYPHPQCISSGGIGCDQDSNNISLQCCPGWQCVEHPTGQYLGYCIQNSQPQPRSMNDSDALNPNNCPVPLYGRRSCGNWGALTICCNPDNPSATWYSCDGRCYRSNDAATAEG